MSKIHTFQVSPQQTSPTKQILKSKEEGKILGLPKQDQEIKEEILQPDEPSFYFYEDDDTELDNLITIVYPILEQMEYQI